MKENFETPIDLTPLDNWKPIVDLEAISKQEISPLPNEIEIKSIPEMKLERVAEVAIPDIDLSVNFIDRGILIIHNAKESIGVALNIFSKIITIIQFFTKKESTMDVFKLLTFVNWKTTAFGIIWFAGFYLFPMIGFLLTASDQMQYIAFGIVVSNWLAKDGTVTGGVTSATINGEKVVGK